MAIHCRAAKNSLRGTTTLMQIQSGWTVPLRDVLTTFGTSLFKGTVAPDLIGLKVVWLNRL
jgi:hypothetical protein